MREAEKIVRKKGKFNFECAQLLNIKWNPIHNGTLTLLSGPIFICLPKWTILVFVVWKLGQHSRCVFDNAIKTTAKKLSSLRKQGTIEGTSRSSKAIEEKTSKKERKKCPQSPGPIVL